MPAERADGAWRHEGRVIYSSAGRLFELTHDGEREAPLADFSADEFVQLKPATCAKKWPSEVGAYAY